MEAVRWLGRMYRKQPMAGSMLLYVGLYGAGDISRQFIQHKRDPSKKNKKFIADFKSAGRLSLVGFALIAPFNYNFYRILDQVVLGQSTRIVITKVICDQVISTPIAISLFYIGTSVLEGKKDKLAELREKGLQTYMTGAVFWSCVQSVNFALLPSYLRTPYVGCCAFFWCNILSFFKSSAKLTVPVSDALVLNTKNIQD